MATKISSKNNLKQDTNLPKKIVAQRMADQYGGISVVRSIQDEDPTQLIIKTETRRSSGTK
jgi:hypothetical protein